MLNMLINCIIFAVVIWRVLSALGLVGGETVQTVPKNMTPQKRPGQQAKPPAQPRNQPVTRESSVWNFDEYRQKTDDWEEFRAKNGPNFRPEPDKATAERERLQKIKEKLERQKREAAVKKAKPESKKADVTSQVQSQVGFTHLPEHAAEVHLENPFNVSAKSDAQAKTIDGQPSTHAELIRLLKDPKHARNAFVLSQILGEPKALSNRGTGIR